MANANRPNGLSPVSSLTGVSSWAQQGRLYCIPASDATSTYAIGDVVKSAAGSDANGVPNVGKATGSDVPLGIVVGVRQADPGVSLVGVTIDLANIFVPKTKARAYYVYVIDEPTVMFEVQFDATAIVSANLHLNCALTYTADQTTTLGPSSPFSSTVATAPAVTATLPIRLLGAIQRPDNAVGSYVRVLAKFNTHEFGMSAGTGFTGV